MIGLGLPVLDAILLADIPVSLPFALRRIFGAPYGRPSDLLPRPPVPQALKRVGFLGSGDRCEEFGSCTGTLM